MNEKTKQRLESELTVPAPTQPVDKLRLAESPAAAASAAPAIGGCTPGTHPGMCYEIVCFADDE